MKFNATGFQRYMQTALFAAALLISGTGLAASASTSKAETNPNAEKKFSTEQISQHLQQIARRAFDGTSSVEDSYLLATLARYSEDTNQLNEIIRLGAILDILSGKFQTASEDLADLTENSSGEMMRFAREMGNILQKSPDGYYSSARSGQSGRLNDYKLLRTAIVDRALELLDYGRELTRQAEAALQNGATDSAIELYLNAFGQLMSAETMRGGCARRELISTARQSIELLKKRTEASARQFDADLKKIGKQKLQRASYAKLLTQMSKCLKTVRTDLEDIIMLTQCDSDSFAVELDWACQDLQRVERMAATINSELEQL